MGVNPIKETIRLKRDSYSSYFLELNTDGTAFYIDVDYDDDNTSNKEEIETTYKYSYDDEEKTITMIVEKVYYRGFFEEEEVQWLTYGELCSKIDEDITVEKLRQSYRKFYESEKDDEDFKKYYPDCNSYEDFEKVLVKKSEFASLDALVNYEKQWYKNYYKTMFGAKITYAYEIEGGKMTLTEKFTGVKNMFNSECRFYNELCYVDIDCYRASIEFREDDGRYRGDVNTDKKTISFEFREDEDENGNREKVNATYKEDIANETVTIKFKDKEYVCKFEADKYIQE